MNLMTPLVGQSACALRQQIAEGLLSPVELLEAVIDQITKINPAVNAVIATDYQRARVQAKEAETAVKQGKRLGMLHGLPVLIKDLCETEGLSTTYGSLVYKDFVPDVDSAVVAQLKEAGAIVIGKTNTPEFGAGANTSNKVYGETCNPFNTQLTSGGSSGGSAVAIACDMAPLAIGSDLGGSLRIPASFCSVVGMRASPGVVPSNGHVLGFSPLWTDGPMAKSVDDLALCLGAITHYESMDPLSRPAHRIVGLDKLQSTDLATLNVGYSIDLGVALIDESIANVFQGRIAVIENAFKQFSKTDYEMPEAAEAFRILRTESIFAAYSDLPEHEFALLGDNVKNSIREAAAYSFPDIAMAGKTHTKLFREFQSLFNDIDLLICPATAVTPFAVCDNFPNEINGRSLHNYYGWYAITWALSLTGCPIITIPFGQDHHGMPFGIQLVAARYQDKFLLETAKAIETLLTENQLGRVSPDFVCLEEASAGS